MNCWDFKGCGREKDGKNAAALGVCPAYPSAGQTCARMSGTLCGGQVQGTFAQKLHNCLQCDYYTSPHYKKGTS